MGALAIDPSHPIVLTLEEAASRLSLEESYIIQLVREKTLTGFRIGRAWRIRAISVDEYEQSLVSKSVIPCANEDARLGH